MDSLANTELLSLGSPQKTSVNSVFSNISAASSPYCTQMSNKENFAFPRVPLKKNKKSGSQIISNEITGKIKT